MRSLSGFPLLWKGDAQLGLFVPWAFLINETWVLCTRYHRILVEDRMIAASYIYIYHRRYFFQIFSEGEYIPVLHDTYMIYMICTQELITTNKLSLLLGFLFFFV